MLFSRRIINQTWQQCAVLLHRRPAGVDVLAGPRTMAVLLLYTNALDATATMNKVTLTLTYIVSFKKYCVAAKHELFPWGKL